jgi:perosamine synthetase
MKQIPLAKPRIGISEKYSVLKVLNSGLLAQGKEVLGFESEFSEIVSGRSCVAVNSGTSALHMGLLSLGIGPGDEVITSPFTFAATANAIALTGATPIFADINPGTFNIDPDEVALKITARTKAILVVHLYGLAAEMPAIKLIAEKHGLYLIEDAAQAHMATVFEQPVGTFGDLAIFSFYPTKNMTSGEGGMIVAKDAEVVRNCRLLRNQGMEIRYQNEIVGFNLRMTDIHAALGRAQLKKLSKWTVRRQEIAQIYNDQLDLPNLPIAPNGYQHVYHQYTLRIPKDRDLFSQELTEIGIGNGVYYPISVDLLPAFKKNVPLMNAGAATKEVISIPVHPSLRNSEIKRIVKQVNRIFLGGKFCE